MCIGDECLGIASDQLFWNAKDGLWIAATSFRDCDIVVNAADVYLIGVADYHNFFVTKADICVHNFFPPVIVAISVAFGLGSAELAGISAGVAAFGSFLGYQWHKKDKEKHKVAMELQFCGGGMVPEDPDEEKKRKRDEARDNYESLNNQDAKKNSRKNGL